MVPAICIAFVSIQFIELTYPGCARGGGRNQILGEKKVVFILMKNMHKIEYFHQEGGGATPALPYAGHATETVRKIQRY